VDKETGLLKVGPQGAGAHPGPVCYGVGGNEPTVTDADLMLGYLNKDYFLGGRMKLNEAGARKEIEEKIGKPLGMSVIEAASGIYRIANAHMSDLIRKATVERGYDPRSFVLFCFGGASPVHAGRYAAELGIKQIVVPLTASVQGAMGLVSSDVVYQYGKSDHIILPADVKRVNGNFKGLIEKGLADLKTAGFKGGDIVIRRSVDMRYRYQVHELNVPFDPGTDEIAEKDMEELSNRFDELYEMSYGKGSAYREAGAEIISFRVTAVGKLKKPNIKKYPLKSADPRNGLRGKRDVYFEEHNDFVPTAIYEFDRLESGNEIPGPAVIETPVTTIVVNPKSRASMDEFRNIKVALEA
jgi:N-methylhydantoinase A